MYESNEYPVAKFKQTLYLSILSKRLLSKLYWPKNIVFQTISSLKCTLRTVFHFSRHTGQIVIKQIERRILNLSKCVISVMFLWNVNENLWCFGCLRFFMKSIKPGYLCVLLPKTSPSVLRQQTSFSINHQNEYII